MLRVTRCKKLVTRNSKQNHFSIPRVIKALQFKTQGSNYFLVAQLYLSLSTKYSLALF